MSRPSAFPEPLIIPPISSRHKQTFVLLHGRGSSAAIFGPALLSMLISLPSCPSSPTANLPALFPHARFVFPNAARSRATCYRRSRINQWFDCWHVAEDADAQPWLQVDGLRETVAYLHRLVRAEAAVVGGLGNVVLGGISQGCAASLVGGLLFEGERGEERLGGMVGMCGWLPFRRLVKGGRTEGDADVDGPGDEDYLFDPFERAASEVLSDAMATRPGGSVPDALASSITRLREALQMPRQASKLRPIRSTPIFMGHGTEDEKVPVMLGRATANRILSTGVRVSWHEYPGLGHWFSSAMLADIVQFLKENTGWDASST